MALNKKEWFMIDSKPIYLTHGNFGGSFKCTFESKMHWQKQLESNPHHFINYQLYDEIVNSRNALSKFLGCESEDLIYFPNPTTALNTVIKNIDLNHNDEVLTSNHEYGALDKTWDYYSTKKGFSYKKVCIDIPYDSKEKFINSFLNNINKNTKVIFLSHITSSTGLIFPIKEICEIAKERNILTIIDGAHAPCHIDLNILDIGCGGGLISEPLARLGGNVTGIDASEKNIKVANIHSKKNKLNIRYINKSPEQLNEFEKFDVILNLEIVEHVENVELYINSCHKLLKKNGIMFTATLNRTFTSYIKAIIGAEYILRWLPIGTHDWNKFIKPEELETSLSNAKFNTLDISGLEFNPITRKWKKSRNLSVNYIICSLKY